ncbi:MAG: MFS transporter [Patulibacter minatonensis]
MMSSQSTASRRPEHWQRLGILAICCFSLLLIGLDATAVNVALPSVRADLDASVAELQWTVDAYTVVMASFLMLAGATADRIGRRRTFVTGLLVFTGASVLCSVAPTIELLLAARVLQALGAAMMNPVAMSIITNTFTDPRERAQAIGAWGAMFGLSMAIGPIVGGALVDATGWRGIFWINLPVGLAAIALTLRFVPESRAPRPRRPDPVGQVLMVAFLACLTFAIIELPGRGSGSAPVVASFVVAALAVTGLLAYERRRVEPLIDLRFFRSVPFASSVGLAVAVFAGFGGFLFVNALYLQDVRGLSPLDAGLATAPMAVVIAIASPISGRLVGRFGPRPSLVTAGIAGLVGASLLLGVDASTPLSGIVAAYAVFGLGLGLVNAPITNAAVSGMPRAQAGVAAGIASTSRQVGMTLGVAVIGAVVSAHTVGSDGLATAIRPALGLVACAEVLVLVLAFVATSRWARASAERTARRLNPEALVDYPGPA